MPADHRPAAHAGLITPVPWDAAERLTAPAPPRRRIGPRPDRPVPGPRRRGVAVGGHRQPVPLGLGEELPGLVAGVGGDAAQRAFAEQVPLIVQRRDVAEVDSGDRQRRPGVQGLQGDGHQLAGGREQDRRVQGFGRAVRGALHRGRPEPGRQLPRGRAPRHHVDSRTARERDLGGQMGAAAEAVDAERAARGQRGTQQRVIADDARAQQRRQFLVAISARQRQREVRGDGGEFGIAAVGVPAGVARVRAQVLRAAQAEPATPAGVAQPGDPHAVPDRETPGAVPGSHHLGDHLVPGRHPRPVHRQIPLRDVQVRPAHPAGQHPYQQFPRARVGTRGGRPPHRPARDRTGTFHPPHPHVVPPSFVVPTSLAAGGPPVTGPSPGVSGTSVLCGG